MEINSAVRVSSVTPLGSGNIKDKEKPTTESDNLVVDKTKRLEKLALDKGGNANDGAEEIQHYSYEDKPWLTYKSNWPDLHFSDKEKMYLFDMTVESIGRLRDIRFTFKEFSDRLKDLRPDLASTSYGFTLDENAKIKILDGSNKFSEADKLWISDEINKFKDFGTKIHAHSKALMTLVDHRSDFGGAYALNRHNFQDIIDYGDILNMSWENQDQKIIQMVHSHAPRKSAAIVNTYA